MAKKNTFKLRRKRQPQNKSAKHKLTYGQGQAELDQLIDQLTDISEERITRAFKKIDIRLSLDSLLEGLSETVTSLSEHLSLAEYCLTQSRAKSSLKLYLSLKRKIKL